MILKFKLTSPYADFSNSHLEDTNQVRLPDSAADISAAQELYTQGDHDAGTLANVEVQDRDVGTIYSQPSSSGIMKIIPHEESNVSSY